MKKEESERILRCLERQITCLEELTEMIRKEKLNGN